MVHKTTLLVVVLLSPVLIFSCVSSKKYNAATAEVNQLKDANAQQANQNAELQQQVATLTSSNKSMSAEFSSYQSSCEYTQKQLNAYKASAKEESEKIDAMKEKLLQALSDFADKGVTVYSKENRIYVNMEDNLLYKPGSVQLGGEGKKALGNLAMALNEYPDVKIVVVGHADNKEIKKGNSDNLILSTERAIGVVRVFRDEFEVDPARLTAAGQGKYQPVSDNTTEEGRAKNRRTEIILNPDFEKIWSSVQK